MRLAKRLKSPPLIKPLALAKPALSPAPPPEAGLPPSSPKATTDVKLANSSITTKEKETEETKLSKYVKKQLHKMSNEELEYLLSSRDNFALDCLLETMPSISKLKREHDELEKQNTDLAKFNYAREPEFVKDRLKLREVLEETSALRKRLMCKQLIPILEKLDTCHSKLAATTCKLEEQCEQLVNDFLVGHKSLDTFKTEYLELRASASRSRILADKLAQEQLKLLGNLPKPADTGSPVPAPRQRKRVSFNR